jgi:type VI secretion system secreted protein Hcp
MAAYAYIEGIKGESQDAGHEEWVNLLSVDQAIHRPISGGASGSTRHRSSVIFDDIVIMKEVDASTPKLAEAIADGAHIPTVKIHLCTSSEGGQRVPYLQWELKNVRVTDYNLSAMADEGAVPTEQVAFNFEEIKQIYDKLDKQNKSQGKVEYTWKVEEGAK